jgi:hypothetical protein
MPVVRIGVLGSDGWMFRVRARRPRRVAPPDADPRATGPLDMICSSDMYESWYESRAREHLFFHKKRYFNKQVLTRFSLSGSAVP